MKAAHPLPGKIHIGKKKIYIYIQIEFPLSEMLATRSVLDFS
jgi:hypothetical protein